MAIPQAPNNMADFMTQAQDFAKRAKAQGMDDTGIANTIRFMYGLTQQNIANEQSNQMTPYQQAQLDLENRKLKLAEQEAGVGSQVIDVSSDLGLGDPKDVAWTDLDQESNQKNNVVAPSTEQANINPFQVTQLSQQQATPIQQEQPVEVTPDFDIGSFVGDTVASSIPGISPLVKPTSQILNNLANVFNRK